MHHPHTSILYEYSFSCTVNKPKHLQLQCFHKVLDINTFFGSSSTLDLKCTMTLRQRALSFYAEYKSSQFNFMYDILQLSPILGDENESNSSLLKGAFGGWSPFTRELPKSLDSLEHW